MYLHEIWFFLTSGFFGSSSSLLTHPSFKIWFSLFCQLQAFLLILTSWLKSLTQRGDWTPIPTRWHQGRLGLACLIREREDVPQSPFHASRFLRFSITRSQLYYKKWERLSGYYLTERVLRLWGLPLPTSDWDTGKHRFQKHEYI